VAQHVAQAGCAVVREAQVRRWTERVADALTQCQGMGAEHGLEDPVAKTGAKPVPPLQLRYTLRKFGSTQPSLIGVHSTVTFMPMCTSSAEQPVMFATSRVPGAPSRSTTTGT